MRGVKSVRVGICNDPEPDGGGIERNGTSALASGLRRGQRTVIFFTRRKPLHCAARVHPRADGRSAELIVTNPMATRGGSLSGGDVNPAGQVEPER